MRNILELVKEYLTDKYYNDKENTVLDSYATFRTDNITIACLVYGDIKSTCYVYDEDTVLATNEDLFRWSLEDNEWLEFVAKESKEAILEWIGKQLENQSCE